jgi:hypothetical protein
MSHPEPEVLRQDYLTIREWERSNRLFTVR